VTEAPTPAAPQSDTELEELLSRPPAGLHAALTRAPGDLVVLGAGGKMGPSLARMAKRADPRRSVFAVSRWSNSAAAAALEREGITVLHADLLAPHDLARLPDAPNVVFMAGQKFGTTGNPATTWAMNAGVPVLVAERYAGARTVVFSTGNVYPLTPHARGGSRETDVPAPVGEYAYSCLARERLFAAAALRHGTPVSIVRLNYAHDLRYGVLTDLAVKLLHGEPVNLAMTYVNVIWQGDANALALASLSRVSAPEPYVVNVAGRETLRVADLARELAASLGVTPLFSGEERSDALLSNAARMSELLPDPLLPPSTLVAWAAEWVRRGGTLLGKPTKFERRDGAF
jgi:nucleoside-diphosphate-sugar epimerase